MEEKIVILGNGFDLRHFLPTSYNHLISILCEIEKLPEDKDSISFSDLFDGAFKEKNEWFYNQINEYYLTENFVFNVGAIQSIKKRLKNNSWFQYFKSVDKNKIETWIDFETEIERVLLFILEYFDSFNNGLLKKPRYGAIQRNENGFFVPVELHNEHFKNRLQIFLLQSFKFLSETYNTFDINSMFVVSIGREIQYYKEKDFFNFIYKSLEDFVGIFNDYLITVVGEFYNHLKEEMKEDFISKNDKFLFTKVDRIFSFNYTSTYINLYKDGVVRNSLIRAIDNKLIAYQDLIHGNTVEDWKNNKDNLKIVLGVDDIHNSLKKNKLFQFTKYFQKLHKQTDYLFLKDFQKTNKTKSQVKYTFYFWGHSLDYSDRQYIREVFDLVENSEGSKIKIFYHSISAKGDQLKNLLGIIEKEIIEKFMKDKIIEFIESTPENLFKEL